MLDRMRGGRWKVFKGDNDAWLDEFRTYHRDAKTGVIVKEADDAISASRYGMMSLRHGRTDAARARFNRQIVYPPHGKILMTDIHYVTVQLRAPRGDGDYGLIEEGFYKVVGETVVLVTNKGEPLRPETQAHQSANPSR
jgi:hypothetical protein